MSDPAKNPLFRKDSSDSGDEANVPKDQGASSRVCPIIEEPLVSEASASSAAEMEGAVGGEDPSTSLSGALRQSCLSPSRNPDDAAAGDSGKTSPKRSPVIKMYDAVKNKAKKVYRKISPTKTSPKKSPKKEKSPKEKKSKREKNETRDIKSLPPSSTGFQPCYTQYYDVKSLRSVEDTDYTEIGEPMSSCEVASISPDSLPTSPSKDPDDDGTTPKKVGKSDFKKDYDKDDDDKDKAA